MKVFQAFFPTVLFYRDFKKRNPNASFSSYEDRIRALLQERFHSPHILLPALEESNDFFFSYANDQASCRLWAKEHGLASEDPEVILIDQIKAFRPDILYVMNPFICGPAFAAKVRPFVGKIVAWHAGPHINADFSSFDHLLSNYPPFLEAWAEQGLRASLFHPAVDDSMLKAQKEKRKWDITFVGNLGGMHHQRRTAQIANLAEQLSDNVSFKIHAVVPRFIPLFPNSQLLRRFIPAPRLVLPKSLRGRVAAPSFGLSMYEVLGSSRISINAAGNPFNTSGESTGGYRVNMRCFEALGCGSCMLSDAGKYPQHFVDGGNYVSYSDTEVLVERISELLQNPEKLERIAKAGSSMVHANYNKHKQWDLFCKSVA